MTPTKQELEKELQKIDYALCLAEEEKENYTGDNEGYEVIERGIWSLNDKIAELQSKIWDLESPPASSPITSALTPTKQDKTFDF